MIGTRGVPARYGGFETAIEEVGRRLADRMDQRVFEPIVIALTILSALPLLQ